MQGLPGTYGFFYDHDGNTYALNWNFFGKGWSVSDYDGTHWHPHNETDGNVYKALLEHFGLTAWKDEYPFEKIRYMGPRGLALERRTKEAKDPSLPVHQMRSDTVDNHVEAEHYSI